MNTPMQEAMRPFSDLSAGEPMQEAPVDRSQRGQLKKRCADLTLRIMREHDINRGDWINAEIWALVRAALPPPAPATGMSDEEIDRIFDAHKDAPTMSFRYLVARAILSAGEKKT